MVANEMRSARSYLVARELKRCKRIHGVVTVGCVRGKRVLGV